MSRFVFGLGLSSMLLAAGCSGPTVEEEETGEASSELRARNCTLLETCPNDIQIVAGVDFGEEVPDDVRTDVTIQSESVVAYELQRRTFGPLTAKVPVSIKLSGGWVGNEVFTIDDVLIVEMLDAQSGERLAAVSASWYADGKVLLDGVAIPRVGAAGSLDYAAGSIDLGPWVPQNRPFKLRVTAVDTGGRGRVSHIVAHVTAASSPPPTPAPDPFDEHACDDAPLLTFNAAKAYFAPAATWATLPIPVKFYTRERACNDVTGCAPWRTTNSTLFVTDSSSRSGIHVPAEQATTVHMFISQGRIWGSLKGTKYDRPNFPGYVNTLGAVFPIGASGGGTLLTTAGDVATSTGSPIRGTLLSRTVTKQCVQLRAKLNTNDPSVQRQAVWFGHL